MKLLGDTVLIENLRELNVRERRDIILPEDRVERGGTRIGTIVAVGKKAPSDLLKEGMNVIVSSYLGTVLQDGRRIYSTEDVLAIVD